jgi:hypothetical protein
MCLKLKNGAETKPKIGMNIKQIHQQQTSNETNEFKKL